MPIDDEGYFLSDPDWEAFAIRNGYPLPSDAPAIPLAKLEPCELDFRAARVRQVTEHSDWRATHPLESVGYTSKLSLVKARDGTDLSVKISQPLPSRLRHKANENLPVLFVTHGGGWIQGSHTSEEAWLLWPLYEPFDLVIISVEYRLAPEHPSSTWVDDSWDVLEKLIFGKEPVFANLDVSLDLQNIILAGSSAGAGISAALSQICRDRQIPISGVVLNVPVLCDYRHFGSAEETIGHPLNSYSQCSEALLSSNAMIWIWNMLHPSSASSANPKASPLLGECDGLPRHLILVAGQDALRDEGIAYAKKLETAGVQVDLKLYKGVPHIFAEMWELHATKAFWSDIRGYFRQWLSEAR